MIKRTIGITFFFLMSLAIYGQDRSLRRKNVSTIIQDYVQSNYPSPKRIRYYQELENGKEIIECGFRQKGVEYSLKFHADSLIETEIEIEFDEIPDGVQQIIQSNLDSAYVHYRILECEIINPDANAVYEIKVRSKSGNYYELFYDQSGNLIRMSDVIILPIPSQF